MAQQREVCDNFNHKSAEFFFNKIRENLTSGTPEKICQSVDAITKKLDADKDYKLNVTEFTLIGDLAYLVGLDMANNNKFYKRIPVTNFIERFKVVNLNTKQFSKSFDDILFRIKTENIIPAKEELKTILVQPIKTDALQTSALKAQLKNLFKHFSIPVNFAIGLDEILNSKNALTYNDILKLNGLIQNNTTFLSGALKSVMKLYNDAYFNETLRRGDELFQLQKFGVMYFDSIISAVELHNSLPEFMFFIGDENEYKTYDFEAAEANVIKKEEQAASEQIPAEVETATGAETEVKVEFNEKFHPKEVERATKLQDEEPDYFVRSVLEEQMGRPIVTLDDFKEAVMKCISNKDFIQYFYQYLSANKARKDRKPFDDVWAEFTPASMEAFLDTHIQQKREEYKELAESMLKPIPSDKTNSIINYLNECINNLIITTPEAKNYLISQIAENQVSTYRHLQQMLGLVEQQQISGTGYYTYVVLYNYLDTQTDCKDIFAKSHKADAMGVEISAFIGLKQFIFPESDVEYPKAKAE